MDLTHLHLLLNHVPLMGVIFGILVFIFSLFRKSDELKKLSLYFFIISALFAVPVYLSGEHAEETVEHLPGVLESIIERHEDSAKLSMLFTILLGLSSAIFVLIYNNPKIAKVSTYMIMILSLLSFGTIANTASLGGQIRHTEISSAVSDNNSDYTNENKGENDDDDD